MLSASFVARQGSLRTIFGLIQLRTPNTGSRDNSRQTSIRQRKAGALDTALRRFKAEFFKALAHPGRIQIIESLRTGEKTVGDIQALLIEEPASASQHLSLLRAKGIVVGRKSGTNVYYRVRDPKIFNLFDVAREIFNAHLVDTQEMLSQLFEEELAASAVGPAETN
jgi:ArsR family transcriptional regulator